MLTGAEPDAPGVDGAQRWICAACGWWVDFAHDETADAAAAADSHITDTHPDDTDLTATVVRPAPLFNPE